MKKYTLLFVAFCLGFFSFCASGQKIHITDTSNYWLYTHKHMGHYNDYITYEEIKYKDTTVTLNGHTYNQTEGCTSFLIREEGNKVYIKGLSKRFFYSTYLSDTTNEFLFFDYDLQVNDTLTLPIVAYVNDQTSKHVILSVDSMLINNIWHKTFLIDPISFDNNNYTFIEGIGSTRYGPAILHEYAGAIPQMYQYLPYLTCFKNNGINPLNGYSDCSHQVTSIFDPESSYYFHVYPNPANEEVTIEYSGAKTADYNISISDLFGRTLLKTTFQSKKKLDISNLLSGMYILQIADENGIIFRDKIIVSK